LPFYQKDIYDLDVQLYNKSLDYVSSEAERNQLPQMPIFAQAEIPYIEHEYKVYLVDKHHWVFQLDSDPDSDSRTLVEEPEVVAIAQKARKTLGLDICSVDIVRNDSQYTLIDLNVSPRLESVDNGPDTLARFLVNRYGNA
jgi:glutathione synthase/RimK-type ligase-like ATP-grasp enzyme